MFPLKERKLIRGAAAHVRAGLGVGADYHAVYVPLYAPFSGDAYEPYWYKFGLGQGGKWVGIVRPNGDRIEFAHLSKYLIRKGKVYPGQQLGVTGNTGTITTMPHLHVQVFDRRGKRLDPEKYDWEEGIDVPGAFKRVWGRPGAPGDIAYFEKRLKDGSIKDAADLEVKLNYWHGIVYPGGEISPEGDARWQREKNKYLLK